MMYIVTTNYNGENSEPKLFEDKFAAKKYFLDNLLNTAIANGKLTSCFEIQFFRRVQNVKCISDIDEIIVDLCIRAHFSLISRGYLIENAHDSDNMKTTIQFFEYYE